MVSQHVTALVETASSTTVPIGPPDDRAFGRVGRLRRKCTRWENGANERQVFILSVPQGGILSNGTEPLGDLQESRHGLNGLT